MRFSYIYVMRCCEYLKVGITKDPEGRRREMRVGNPFSIELVYQRVVPADRALRLELEVHAELLEHHHQGEWFRCTLERAIEAIKAVTGAYKIAETKRDIEREARIERANTKRAATREANDSAYAVQAAKRDAMTDQERQEDARKALAFLGFTNLDSPHARP